MRGQAIVIVVVAVISTTLGQEPPTTDLLLRYVRAGDVEAAEQSLRSGADPNARDASGATALMYAAAFAPAATMRVLLAAGADVNATSRNGATALMWATHDASKVRLLLEEGAAVNAARADGPTALVAAALRGDMSVVETLLDAGADVQIGRVAAPWPATLPQIALTTNDPALHRLFTRSDGGVRKVADENPPPLTRLLLTSVYSWRPQPLATTAGTVNSILDAGADPNEIVNQMVCRFLRCPALRSLGTSRRCEELLRRGANPNLKGSGGLTPLMVAAVASADPTMVRLLLDAGASVDAREIAVRPRSTGHCGWARLVPVASCVQRVRLQCPELPHRRRRWPMSDHQRTPSNGRWHACSRPAQASRARHGASRVTTRAFHQSLSSSRAQRALLLIHTGQSSDAEHAGGLGTASREHASRSLLGVRFPGTSRRTLGLAEEGVAPGPETDAATSCLSGLQKPNGSWEGGDTRPPLAASNPFVYTALAVRGLKSYAPPGRHQDTAARIERARAFLVSDAPADSQEEAFKLLGLVWADASAAEISKQTKRVRDIQRRDGGRVSYQRWPPTPTRPARRCMRCVLPALQARVIRIERRYSFAADAVRGRDVVRALARDWLSALRRLRVSTWTRLVYFGSCTAPGHRVVARAMNDRVEGRQYVQRGEDSLKALRFDDLTHRRDATRRK